MYSGRRGWDLMILRGTHHFFLVVLVQTIHEILKTLKGGTVFFSWGVSGKKCWKFSGGFKIKILEEKEIIIKLHPLPRTRSLRATIYSCGGHFVKQPSFYMKARLSVSLRVWKVVATTVNGATVERQWFLDKFEKALLLLVGHKCNV
jgi:hypothetical protein